MPLVAKSIYDPVLTGIGLLDTSGNITKSAERAFIDEIILLLTLGNIGGKTLVPLSKLVPVPSFAGPKILGQDFFWFNPDPVSGLLAATLLDAEKTPFFHEIFINGLYKSTVSLLNLGGQTPLFPVFDISLPFGTDLKIPFTIPELAVALSLPPIQVPAKLVAAGIKVSIPSIPIPQIPNIAPVGFDFTKSPPTSISLPMPPVFTIPSLITGLIEIPFKVLTATLVPPSLSLVTNLPGLPATIADIAFKLLFQLLSELGLTLILPKTLIATIIVYMKNIVAILCVLIISQLVGVGNIAFGVAQLLGLVKD